MRLRGVKAVLFDLDGTLVDSSEAIVNAVENALEPRGLKSDRAKVVKMIGLPLEDIFSALKPNPSKDEMRQLVFKYREYYAKHHLECTKIHPSTQMLLRTLRASGFKLGIITTKYREPVMDVLSHFDVLELFDAVVAGYEVEKPKPAPDIVFEAAKRLDVDAGQCVVVGDSPVDVQTGKRAGAFTIALLSNTYDRRLLESVEPTAVVEELQAILKFLSCRGRDFSTDLLVKHVTDFGESSNLSRATKCLSVCACNGARPLYLEPNMFGCGWFLFFGV